LTQQKESAAPLGAAFGAAIGRAARSRSGLQLARMLEVLALHAAVASAAHAIENRATKKNDSSSCDYFAIHPRSLLIVVILIIL
jgi:hypothetical protein